MVKELNKRQKLTEEAVESIAEGLSQSLWKQMEFLEGAIEELFLEIDEIDFQRWSKELMGHVKEAKQCLDDAINRLEIAFNGFNKGLVL